MLRLFTMTAHKKQHSQPSMIPRSPVQAKSVSVYLNNENWTIQTNSNTG